MSRALEAVATQHLKGHYIEFCHCNKMQSICFHFLKQQLSVSHKTFRISVSIHLILVIQLHSATCVMGVGGNVLRFLDKPTLQ